jgi:hypothetical protein
VFMNSYQIMLRCLCMTGKIKKLSLITGISKSTLTHIAKGRGTYDGTLATRMKLEAFLLENSNRQGRPFKTTSETKHKNSSK